MMGTGGRPGKLIIIPLCFGFVNIFLGSFLDINFNLTGTCYYYTNIVVRLGCVDLTLALTIRFFSGTLAGGRTLIGGGPCSDAGH
jgi:hypothetical protein